MRRYYLKQDDKSSALGVVVEGEPSCLHYGTPLTYVGAKVYCESCKTMGVIAAKGPRLSESMMGRQPALSGDVCICECDPPPIMHASQDNDYQDVHVEEKAPAPAPVPFKSQPPVQRHTQRILAWDSETGMPLPHQAYVAELEDGTRQSGRTDERGIATIETDAPQSFRIHIVFASPKRDLKPRRGL